MVEVRSGIRTRPWFIWLLHPRSTPVAKMSRFLVLLPPHLMHLLVTDSCRGRQSTASDCDSAEEASRIHLNVRQARTGFCERNA